MTRKELREHIFKLLYCVGFWEQEEIPRQFQLYFMQIGAIRKEDRDDICQKCQAVLDKTQELDEMVNRVMNGWKTSRMNKVDLAILRLALYELLYDERIPTGVAINEAVELVKKFSSEDAPSFLNGILGRLARERGLV